MSVRQQELVAPPHGAVAASPSSAAVRRLTYAHAVLAFLNKRAPSGPGLEGVSAENHHHHFNFNPGGFDVASLTVLASVGIASPIAKFAAASSSPTTEWSSSSSRSLYHRPKEAPPWMAAPATPRSPRAL